jgi:Tat protein secretion system quality control protein TatD with DNase activity
VGLHVSIGPDVLRSRRALASAVSLPLERLLLESDAPERPIPGASVGEPAHIAVVAAAIAEARGLTAAEVLAVSGTNARQLLRYSSTWPP